MTTDTLPPIKTKRVEYSLSDVYNAVEARLDKLNAQVAALPVAPSQNWAAGMIVSQQQATQAVFNTLAEWKKQGVQTLVTDTAICSELPVNYKPGETLAEQIKAQRLKPL
jgi:hypothetical protein